jgi:hypothetical protein
MQRPGALALLFLLACAPALQKSEPEPPPRPRSLVTLSEVAVIGPYLGATLTNERFSLRFFFPQSPDCQALIRSEAQVRYLRMGSFGTVVGEERRRCEPVGVGSLREWRDQQPRRRDRHFTPRVHVDFRTFFEAEDLLLLRGRFPLAMEIRWPAAMDSVVMLPAEPTCDEVRQRGEATMEYHDTGPVPFVLVEAGQRCPILGFAVPIEID